VTSAPGSADVPPVQNLLKIVVLCDGLLLRALRDDDDDMPL
jgi:hypothetical protein